MKSYKVAIVKKDPKPGTMWNAHWGKVRATSAAQARRFMASMKPDCNIGQAVLDE